MAWYSAVANRGYVAQGREKLVVLEETGTEAELRKTVPDLKESLEIGRDDQPETPNMWPSGDDDAKVFKENMLQFFETCKGLHIQVMRAIALGMGIGESWFDGFTDAGDNTLRLLHYPGVSKSVFKRTDGQEQVRAGEHSDYGTSSYPLHYMTVLTDQAPSRSSSKTSAAAYKCARPKAPSSTPRPSKTPSSLMLAICWPSGPMTRSSRQSTVLSSHRLGLRTTTRTVTRLATR
jgi:hypothetical protein